MALLQALKAQRAAALAREVSYMAQLPLGMNAIPTGNHGGANRTFQGAMVGAIRQRQLEQQRMRYTPYTQLPNRMVPVSRTTSSAESACTASWPSPKGPEPMPLKQAAEAAKQADAAAKQADAAAGLLSLSPLNSPQLASCVDLLSTPDLIGIAIDRGKRMANPMLTQMWLPPARLTGNPLPPPDRESGSTPPPPLPLDNTPLLSPTPATPEVLDNLPRVEMGRGEDAPSLTPEHESKRARLGSTQGSMLLKGAPAAGGMLLHHNEPRVPGPPPSLVSSEQQPKSIPMQRRPSLTMLDMLSGH